MTSTAIGANHLFRTRDFFVHDGAHLRRVRLSVPVQALMALALLMLVGWSAFATSQMLTGSNKVPGDMASLAAATELRAQQIEQRQMTLARMLSGQDIDPAELAAGTPILDLPDSIDGKFAAADQTVALQALAAARALDQRYAATAAELQRLGISPARFTGQGGPLESASGGDATFRQLFSSWKKLDNLADGAIAVPSEKPVRDADFTSGFGVRSDPFKGRAAMHAGIDLAGPLGTPIYATADGIVRTADSRASGYGNLIKIDHGKGIETRYGHLSAFVVSAGQRVKRGQLIGRMGSTGRSTGSHLHYEVRIDGRAVNPIPFMKSNDYLLAMQKKGADHRSMDAVALGGPTKR